MSLSEPELLAEHHELAAFDCGVASLNDWLKRRARANQVSGASRTYVVCSGKARVVGYYALASGAITVDQTPGRFRRNMPDPVPIVLLGRLAVDVTCQGRQLGRALFKDAGLRVLHAAETIGVRGIVVHAISAEAKAFYTAIGFDESPLDPMTLMISLADLQNES